MTNNLSNELEINGQTYVLKSLANNNPKVTNLEGLVYTMVRTYSAGVFAGYLKERNGKEVLLLDARRIYQWQGACSLSQLATYGTSLPEKCLFPCEVSEVLLLEAIELIPITEKAMKSIASVEVWKS